MATRSQNCSIPSGKIYIGPWSGLVQATISAGSYYPQLAHMNNEETGLVEDGNIAYTLQEQTLVDANGRAGGIACYGAWITDAMVNMNIRAGRGSITAMALLGRNQLIAGASVTAELHMVSKNTANTVQATGAVFVPFNRVPDVTQAITVTGIGGTPTYTVAAGDYLVAETGILIPPASTIPVAVSPYTANNLQVNYVALDTARIDGMVTTPQDLTVICDGFDRASGAQRQTHIYRVKGVSDGVPFVTGEFINFKMKFRMLPDPRIPVNQASPTSQYFHILQG